MLSLVLAACAGFVEGLEVLSRSERMARWAFGVLATRLISRHKLDIAVEESLIDARESIKKDKIDLFESVDDATKAGLLELRELKKIDEILEEYTATTAAGGIDSQAGRNADRLAGGVEDGEEATESHEYVGHDESDFDH
jgi:hypothetical protein